MSPYTPRNAFQRLRPTLGALLLLALLAGCQPAPRFVNHTPPDLPAAAAPFAEDSALADMGCDEIVSPSDMLGGLDPTYPLAECRITPFRDAGGEEPEPGSYFFNVGGMLPTYVRYVVFRDGQFELVENADAFRALFAPVTTPEEALSFALAVKPLQAYYGLRHDPNLEYFVDRIEDSHVEEIAGGYRVHLFDYQLFGCGPHHTYAVEVEVTADGHVQEIGREPIYKDPTEDGLCVD